MVDTKCEGGVSSVHLASGCFFLVLRFRGIGKVGSSC